MDVQSKIVIEAQRQGVDPRLALAVAWEESRFDQADRGAAGEVGVFQLMPGTAAQLGVDPYDLDQNIRGGISFLADQINSFGLPAGLWAYNWGPGRVRAYLDGRGGPPPSSTLRYAQQILKRAGGQTSIAQNSASSPGASPTSAVGPNVTVLFLGLLGTLVLISALA